MKRIKFLPIIKNLLEEGEDYDLRQRQQQIGDLTVACISKYNYAYMHIDDSSETANDEYFHYMEQLVAIKETISIYIENHQEKSSDYLYKALSLIITTFPNK